jgi:hypothetical protein
MTTPEPTESSVAVPLGETEIDVSPSKAREPGEASVPEKTWRDLPATGPAHFILGHDQLAANHPDER